MRILFIVVLTISILINIAFSYISFVKNPLRVEGAVSWIHLYSEDVDATFDFLTNNLDIKPGAVQEYKEAGIYIKDIRAEKGPPYAGIRQIDAKWPQEGLAPHVTLYFTVKNYDVTKRRFLDNGAELLFENKIKDKVNLGVYKIPGGLTIAITEYLKTLK